MIPPHEIAERALEAASALDGAVAIVHATSRADLRWARTTLTTNGESRQTNLTLIGFQRSGAGIATATLSRSQPGAEDVRTLVDRLTASLASAPAAEDAFDLVEPIAGVDAAWGDPPAVTSSASLDPLTSALGAMFAGPSEIELFGYAEHELTTTWLASSTGLRLRHEQPAARLEITAKSHARTRSAWWGLSTDDFHGVDLNPGETELRWALDAQATRVDVEPGRHRAVLTPGAIGDLMVDLWWSSSAREAVEGRSVFSAPDGRTRIGERLGERALTLSSDPFDPVIPAAAFLSTAASSDAASVFDNGLPLGRVDWIREGVLECLLTPRWLSHSRGIPAASSADTLRLADSAGAGGVSDLVARTDDGLLVTCLWYNRVVDPQTLLLTGLTRDGVYVVRGGEVIGAAGNFRFNDSPVAVLGRISDAGVTQRTLPREMGDYAARVAMPPVTVEDFHFSTVSDAL